MYLTAARRLSPEGFGAFSYTLTASSLLAVIVPLGWPLAVTRFVAQYREQKEWALLRGVLAAAFLSTLLLSVFGVVFHQMSRFLWKSDPELSSGFQHVGLVLAVLSFSYLLKHVFIGLQMVGASITIDEIAIPLLVASTWFILRINEPGSALASYVGVSLFTLGVGLWWMLQKLPAEVGRAATEYRYWTWTAAAIPMMLGGLNRLIISRTDVLMLGVMVDMRSVGLYSAASRIALVNVFILSSISVIATPLMASAYHAKRMNEFKSILKNSMLWSTLGTLPMFLCIVAKPEFILGLLGRGFEDATGILVVLAAGQFANAMTGPVGMALLMTEREKLFAITMTVVAAGNAVGNYFVIKNFGAIGAAVVTAFSLLILNVWQMLIVFNLRRKKGPKSQ